MLTVSPRAEAVLRDLDTRPHAVVIGSGFGGLAAAIRLGARGYRVTVLERLDAPGGRAYVHRQDGFTFDAGPTIVTAPFLFEELWALCGGRLSDDVDLRAIDPFYRLVFDDGETIAAAFSPYQAALVATLAATVFLFVFVRTDRLPVAYVAVPLVFIAAVMASGTLESVGRITMLAFPLVWIIAGRRSLVVRRSWPVVSAGLFTAIAVLSFGGYWVP